MNDTTMLIRVIYRGDAHVRVAVWAGRNVGARAKAGELVFRTDEWEELKRALPNPPFVTIEDEAAVTA